MNFNDYETQRDFEVAMDRKDLVIAFDELLVDNMTPEQSKLLGNYLFGIHRDYAAAGHLLMEIAKPAAEFVVRDLRERTATPDDDSEDRAYERRRQEELDKRGI